MSYISRAESAVERGQAMRAFFVLVNGLRRDPSDERGLNMLVELYIREFDSPGVEADLLSVLDLVDDGLDIYEMIHASLEQSGDERRLKSLIQIRERDRRLQHFETLEAASPAAAHTHGAHTHAADTQNYAPAPAQHPAHGPTGRHGGRQSSLAPARPTYDAHREHAAAAPAFHTPTDGPHAPTAHAGEAPHHTQAASPHAWDTQIAPADPAPPQRGLDARTSQLSDDAPNGAHETATTGVFSSINVYLAAQQAQLSDELAQRSKRRLLAIGAVVLVAVLVISFALRPSEAVELSDATPDAAPAVEITEPVAD